MARTVRDYVNFLASKGFILGEEAYGFIEFGQQYTDTVDEIVIIAIELTLKIQKEFDGSFYISLLEQFKSADILNRKQAFQHIQTLNLM
jgi:Family of unknown function (DUF6123)